MVLIGHRNPTSSLIWEANSVIRDDRNTRGAKGPCRRDPPSRGCSHGTDVAPRGSRGTRLHLVRRDDGSSDRRDPRRVRGLGTLVPGGPRRGADLRFRRRDPGGVPHLRGGDDLPGRACAGRGSRRGGPRVGRDRVRRRGPASHGHARTRRRRVDGRHHPRRGPLLRPGRSDRSCAAALGETPKRADCRLPPPEPPRHPKRQPATASRAPP